MGVRVWTEATCIDFLEDRNAYDKVVVVKGSRSSSAVGRLGGNQRLELNGEEATEDNAIHEIGHVLGFFHTMVRYDRDRYIKIIKENLDPQGITDFRRVGKNHADVYGLTYDYGSIMHYSEISGSINGQPTMIAEDSNYQMTMGSAIISFSDIYMINEHYGCNTKCNKSVSAKCENEGYPHPRNCSICICPSGYGGALCDRRAPKGKKIEVKIQWISRDYDEPGCPKGGVEIKAQKDHKRTGYRFCSASGNRSPIVSSSNPLPVILFNRFAVMQAILIYRCTD